MVVGANNAKWPAVIPDEAPDCHLRQRRNTCSDGAQISVGGVGRASMQKYAVELISVSEKVGRRDRLAGDRFEMVVFCAG
jgi:hypothetical protein